MNTIAIIPPITVYYDLQSLTNNTFYQIIERVIVDRAMWYSMMVSDDIRDWLHTQDSTLWYLHKSTKYMGIGYTITNIFDVHEELYLLIKLKFHR